MRECLLWEWGEVLANPHLGTQGTLKHCQGSHDQGPHRREESRVFRQVCLDPSETLKEPVDPAVDWSFSAHPALPLLTSPQSFQGDSMLGITHLSSTYTKMTWFSPLSLGLKVVHPSPPTLVPSGSSEGCCPIDKPPVSHTHPSPFAGFTQREVGLCLTWLPFNGFY